MGPARQSEPLDFEGTLKLKLPIEPIVHKGPLNSHAVNVLGTMFRTREIEAPMARRRHLTLDHEARKVVWKLPVSKTDPQARGCERSWNCICIHDAEVYAGCPYHIAKDHMKLLEDRFGPMKPKDDTPLFPTADGSFVTADAMLALIEELATMLGMPLVDKHGRRIYGKHSWRAAGAVYLTRIGLQVYKIQLLARWASPLITHYARLAPLKTLSTEMKSALAKQSKRDSSERMKETMKKVKKSVDEHIVKVKAEVERLESMIREAEAKRNPTKYLKNRVTGISHLILSSVEEVGSEAITHCGWTYAHKKVEVLTTAPKFKQHACDTCVGPLKRSLPDLPGRAKK